MRSRWRARSPRRAEIFAACLKGMSILGILMSLTSQSALAQNYKDISPQIPEPPAPAKIVPPPEKKAKASKDLVIPSLKGIFLVDTPTKIVRNGVSADGVVASNLGRLLQDEGLDKKLENFIGKPLTLRGMQDLSKTIVDWYRAHNHPLIDVVFPEQDVSAGTLQVVVTEFRLGEIKVVGNTWFTDDQIRDGLRLQPGEIVDYNRLQEDLAWINQNPFRSVDAVFEKGKAAGTTDLDLQTTDQFPLRVYAGYDNTGTPVIGRSRYNLGANWGDAFWDNQMLSYQFTSSTDFWIDDGNFLGNPGQASFTAHSLDDVIPLPWHDKLDIFGAYTNERPQVGSPFSQQGFSDQASFRYIHLFPAVSWLNHEIQFGYDYKASNNDLEFGGTQVFGATTEIDQFLLIYAGNETDPYGETTFKNSLVLSPGNVTAGNTTAAFQQSGTSFAHSDYVYDNLKLTRTIPFPHDITGVTRFVAQVSNGNLLPSEDLSAGGENSVRGYNEEQAIGSQGVLLSEEVRSPTFSLTQELFDHDDHDKAQGLIFLDYGQVGDNLTQPNQQSITQLAGAGLGLRYALGPNFNLNADYGWQLIRPPGSKILGSLVHVAVTVSY